MVLARSKNEKYIWLFVALTGLYIGLILALPADPKTLTQFQVTQSQLRLLLLTIVTPLVAVYFAALYGFVQFKNYADSIRDTKEGPAFKRLADALMLLAFSLPLTANISTLLNYATLNNQDFLPTATIIKNYVALIFPFITFMLLTKGSEALVGTLRLRLKYPPNYTLWFIISLTSIYTWLITTRPHGSTSTEAYFLPNWLIIMTLAVPYVFMWCRGILAAWKLFEYHKNVKGRVYRDAMRYLALGIGCIIFLSVLIQLLSTVSARLESLSLRPVLFFLYVLVAMYAVGYGLVARGAKRLKQIEEA
jgi:hypothetical protein